MKTGTADPPTGSRQLAVPRKLRRAAGRLLVASAPVRDLLFCAKHLFVAALVAITSAGRVNDDQCDRFSREFKVTRAKPDSASILRRRRTFLRLLREAGAPS